MLVYMYEVMVYVYSYAKLAYLCTLYTKTDIPNCMLLVYSHMALQYHIPDRGKVYAD